MRPANTECYYYADGKLFYLVSGVFLGSYEHDFMFGWNGTNWNVVSAENNNGFFPMGVDGKVGYELKDYEQFIEKQLCPAKPFSFESDSTKSDATQRFLSVNVAVLPNTSRRWRIGTCKIDARDDGFYIGQTFIKREDAKSMRRALAKSKVLLSSMRETFLTPFPAALGWEMKTRTAVAVAMAFLYERWYKNWDERKRAKSVVSLWPKAGTNVYAQSDYSQKGFLVSLTMD